MLLKTTYILHLKLRVRAYSIKTLNFYEIAFTVTKCEKRIISFINIDNINVRMAILNQGVDIGMDVGRFQIQIASFLQVQVISSFTEDSVCMAETSCRFKM